MPWDSDIDVQMTASTVYFLASYYNMTIHTYQDRDYMLEINPKYTDGSFKDKLNVIDGRWIDITTGLFIDITAIRPKPKAIGVYASKDKHEEKVISLCLCRIPGLLPSMLMNRVPICSPFVQVHSKVFP